MYALRTDTVRSLDGAQVSPRRWVAPLRSELLLVYVACLCGVVLRLADVTRSDFPLWDGGLFLSITQDLEKNGFVLPLYTSYNHAHIPLGYPPLAFYILGLLHVTFGMPLLQLFRWMPFVVNTVSIVAFYVLARVLLPSKGARVAAVFAFALFPAGLYTLSGGGVTRSLGFFFSLLALSQVVLLYRRGERRYVLSSIVFSSLTVLSHLEWTLFTAYSVVLLFVAFGRNKAAAMDSLLLAVGTACLTSPWWLFIVQRHGLTTFLATLHGSSAVWPWYGRLVGLPALQLTGDFGADPATILGLLGAVWCLASRQRLLPTWLLLISLIEPRGAAERRYIILALMIGIAVEEILVPIVRSRVVPAVRKRGFRPSVLPGALAAVAVLLAGFHTAIFVQVAPTSGALASSSQTAIAWTRQHTPPDSRFLIVTGRDWTADTVGEWFPALTNRVSATTVQGYEWIPGAFARRYHANLAVEDCAFGTARCLQHAMGQWHLRVDYVYLSRQPLQGVGVQGIMCCAGLTEDLSRSPEYVRVYNGPGAAIYRVRHDVSQSE